MIFFNFITFGRIWPVEAAKSTFPPIYFIHYFNSIYFIELLDFLSISTAFKFIQAPVKKICIFWPKMAKNSFFRKIIKKYKQMWKIMKIWPKFRQDPKLKLHLTSFGPNWPLGPVKIPVKQAFFTGI